eukprot:7493990-Karenia_brevis.AAC.1
MAKKMGILDSIKVELQYLQSVKGHMTDEAYLDVCKDKQDVMEIQISRHDKLSTAASLELLEAIKAAKLPSPVQAALLSTIIEKGKSGSSMADKADEKAAEKCKQSCLNMCHIMPIWLWNVLTSPTTPDHELLPAMFRYMLSIGLVYAHEPTYVHIVSIMALCRLHTQPSQTIDPENCKKVGDELKTMIRTHRRKIKMPHYGQIRLYPKNMSDFQTQFPEVYARAFNSDKPENECATCPLDTILLAELEA